MVLLLLRENVPDILQVMRGSETIEIRRLL
jgi:hypothetical protein